MLSWSHDCPGSGHVTGVYRKWGVGPSLGRVSVMVCFFWWQLLLLSYASSNGPLSQVPSTFTFPQSIVWPVSLQCSLMADADVFLCSSSLVLKVRAVLPMYSVTWPDPGQSCDQLSIFRQLMKPLREGWKLWWVKKIRLLRNEYIKTWITKSQD
jgi:hypothetical protein